MHAFEALAATLDYPMYIVTTSAQDERAGCLVGFTTQCSIDPPRFLVCLSKANRTERVARHAEVLVVHLVDAERRDLAELFGGETGDEVDKFAGVRWEPGPAGAPVLDDCARWFAGRILDRFDLGDHVGYLLEPVDGAAEAAGPFFTFQSARTIEAGHPA
ncbi:MAG TPA: flavin reductase family protein [Acidimicrobiales bacterium]|nr:flavin reductase family protein [Acidimicrobiales bacterium]